MSSIAPAPTESATTDVSSTETTSADGAASNTSTTTETTNKEVVESPTKYAHVEEGTPAFVEAEEEGTPIQPEQPSASTPAESPPKTQHKSKQKRVRSRRLSFADEIGGGKLCEVSYHQNLHYAAQEAIPKSKKKKQKDSECFCIIS